MWNIYFPAASQVLPSTVFDRGKQQKARQVIEKMVPPR